MTPDDPNQELLTFFKALADANRLRIVGVLAQEPRSVEQLAAALGLESSTVSHHLRRLSGAGLVEAKADGYYSVYSLRTDALEAKARTLLGREDLPGLAGDADLDAFDRKVLATFVGEDGTFQALPRQERKVRVLLRRTLAAFEPGQRYPERDVNERLARFHEDTAHLRRRLVDFGLMQREGGGGEYWLTDEGVRQRPAAV